MIDTIKELTLKNGNMNTNELLLKTAFCCMACDGEIATEEISVVRNLVKDSKLFEGLDVEEKLNEFVSQINQVGISFLSNFLAEVEEANLTPTEQLEIVKIAIATIEADKNIEYSEIKFFKKLRSRLSISDGKIEKAFPERDDMDTYLLPDMKDSEDLSWNVTFSSITL